jgi:predicted dehydrogenase
MRFLTVGLGSMGKRRIRCLHTLNQRDIIGFDTRLDRRTEAKDLYAIEVADNLESTYAKFKPDAVLICTSPDTHAPLILQAIKHKTHVFSEISIIPDGMEEIITEAQNNNLVAITSSTLRFNPCLLKLRSILLAGKIGKPLAYTYHIGQYLPDWHPWENIKEYFVSKRRTGGGKEILAIQLSFLSWLFGNILSAKADRAILGNLGVDIDDFYNVQIVHDQKVQGAFVAEVLSKPSIVYLRIIGSQGTIKWEGTSEIGIWSDFNKEWQVIPIETSLTNLSGYHKFVAEEPYVKEMENFIEAINGRSKPAYSFSEDLEITRLISSLAGEL